MTPIYRAYPWLRAFLGFLQRQYPLVSRAVLEDCATMGLAVAHATFVSVQTLAFPTWARLKIRAQLVALFRARQAQKRRQQFAPVRIHRMATHDHHPYGWVDIRHDMPVLAPSGALRDFLERRLRGESYHDIAQARGTTLLGPKDLQRRLRAHYTALESLCVRIKQPRHR